MSFHLIVRVNFQVRVKFSGSVAPTEGKEYQLQVKKKDSYALQAPFCVLQWLLIVFLTFRRSGHGLAKMPI